MRLLSTLFALILLGRSLGARRRRDLDVIDESDDEDDSPGEKAIFEEVIGAKLPGSLHSLGVMATNGLSSAALLQYGRAYTGSKAGQKRFAGEVLGYVTPWNNDGYTVAETFGAKFSFISPVWYQLREEGGKLMLTGGHDVDGGWMDRVRKTSSAAVTKDERRHTCDADSGACASEEEEEEEGDEEEDVSTIAGMLSMVPRVIWEVRAGLRESDVPRITHLLKQEAEKHGLDGFTLEMPITQVTVAFTRSLRSALGEQATIILAVPSYQMPTAATPVEYHVTPEVMSLLAESVDRFSIMCYDYGRTPTGLPMAPLEWVKASISSLATHNQVRRKLLLGLPFYGYHQGQPILANTLLDTLRKHKVKATWDGVSKEHVFSYREAGERVEQKMGFPTPAFLQARMDLARELGVAGVAIWELGQGLRAFIDLF